mmetsp:Transcript_8250/g.25531  ORF Transcript_8250/g.25531 Transcript_8250/m.25531 type:complete len:1071 (+) Transcript_8250:228-3440(+)
MTASSEQQPVGFSLRKYVSGVRERWIDYITGVMTKRPCCVLGGAFSFFVVAMVVLALVGTKQTPPSEYEWELPFDKFSERRDMIQSAEDDVDTGLLPTRSDETYDWYFFFDAKPRLGRNVCEGPYGLLSARNVQAMCEAEREFWGKPKYAAKFCPIDTVTGECMVPMNSISRILYGVPDNTALADAPSDFLNCELPDQTSISTIWETEIHVDRSTYEENYEFFFDNKAYGRGWPCRARSLMYIGTPLEGKEKVSQWDDQQYRKIKKQFVNRIQNDLIDKYNMKGKPARSVYFDEARAGEAGEKFEVLWWNPFLEDEQFVEAVNSDFTFAIASIVFVWVWLCVHTSSFFIGSCGMLQILLSLPISLFWYRVVLWRRYIAIMIQLAIFVILGIGADDIFVYVDAWKQSKDLIEPQGDDEPDDEYLRRRVKYAYSRAFQSIFNTSFTTAVAFFATAIAELVPIAAFGFFAALCVIMNFALVLTVTPCIVLIHHRRMTRKKTNPNSRVPTLELADAHDDEGKGIDEEAEVSTATVKNVHVDEQAPKASGCCCCPPCGVCARCCGRCWNADWVRWYLSFVMAGNTNKFAIIDTALHPEAKTAPDLAVTTKEVDELVEAPSSRVSLRRKPVAVVLVATLATYGMLMAAFASRLTPPSEQEVWFPRAHMATKTDKLFEHGYASNDASYYPELSIIWGMDRIKRGKSFDPYVPHKSRGDVRYSSRPIELHGTAAQTQIFNACNNLPTFNCESGCDGNTLVRPDSTLCFLNEFQDWHEGTYNASIQGLGSSVFNSRLSEFRDTTTPASEDYSSWENYIGFVDGELRFVRLDARISMTLEEPTTAKRMVLRRINKFLSRHCRDVSNSGLPEVWQFSYAWIWFKTQRALVNGLLIGMTIAFPVAFLTLVAATQNFVLASFAIVTIGFIVSSVLGLAWMLGWALGIKESVAGVIVIGLSVDYSIHLGHMFDAGRHEKQLYAREDKFVFAMASMGSTVFAGAVTTAGAAIFLLACQLTFFTQMGILILSTIVSSLVYSLFFYMPLLYTFGPEGDFGNLSAMKHAVLDRGCSRCCRKDDEEYVR